MILRVCSIKDKAIFLLIFFQKPNHDTEFSVLLRNARSSAKKRLGCSYSSEIRKGNLGL